ncbi:MAG: urease accessory UreF family protein [Gammaproteobacteria bacterium]|nr:urease accessory UreF family protein [Gammaproteobacteria bacterium]
MTVIKATIMPMQRILTIMFEVDASLKLSRLLQMVSPSLPIGAYTYSQGIEWAVEQGWIATEQDLIEWLEGLLNNTMVYLELPVFIRMLQAWQQDDQDTLRYWNEYLLASRETAELRQEEVNRARAFSEILFSLHPAAQAKALTLRLSQHSCLSYACHVWHIDRQQALVALVWSWLENLVLSAVKIIPLGQTAGQQVVFQLSERLPDITRKAQSVTDADIGASSMALAIASSQHETQYTRLFRS